jgi:hypothetical protein
VGLFQVTSIDVVEPHEIRHRLKVAIMRAGGVKAFAQAHGITRGIVSNVLHGQRVAPVVVEAIGLKKVTVVTR